MYKSFHRLTAIASPSRLGLRFDSVLNAIFLLTGVVTTLLGPLIPLLTARWRISTLQAGNLFVAQFLSSLGGVSFSSLLSKRWGFLSLVRAGSILMGVGVGTIWFLPWPGGLACVASYGVGLGIIIPASNLLIAQIHHPRPAPALNILNLAWGLGAVASSFWIGAFADMHAVGVGLVALGLVIAALPMLMNVVKDPFEPAVPAGPPYVAQADIVKRTKIFSTVAIGLLFYLYVGTETSVGGWVAACAKRVISEGRGPWVLSPGFFWAALLGGRALAPKILTRISDRTLILAELPVAGLGITLLIAAHSIIFIFAGAIVAGIGLAPVFPGTIALMTAHFGEAAKRWGGWMFGLAALGGASLPWLVGYVTTQSRHFRTGLSVPLAATLAMLITFLFGVSQGQPRIDKSY
jgi:FHS family glucose/mannose:H+ symporter-like MFS transporter